MDLIRIPAITSEPDRRPPCKCNDATDAEARVVARVRQCLQDASYYSLRRISCEFHEGILFLRGRVPSYYLKQVAQEIIRKIDGVEEIANRLEVAEPGHHQP